MVDYSLLWLATSPTHPSVPNHDTKQPQGLEKYITEVWMVER